jgi:cellulose synthase/poly-beta-1,6-N-acetylglucosamine synthase-like glycosyltransferase
MVTASMWQVVIPVKDMQDHLDDCLAALEAELGETDRICVIDDASSPPVVVPDHVHLLRLEEPVGPYVARTMGLSGTPATVIVFLDARCRVKPGWRKAIAAAMADDATALACTDVNTVELPTYAGRVAHALQPFRLSAYLDQWLPYFPTCNLVIRKDAFEGVGGFPPVRSGGDAALCWEVQLQGHGGLVADERPLVDWVPRESFADLLRQFYRYGESARQLSGRYPEHAERIGAWQSSTRLPHVRALLGALKRRQPPTVAVGIALTQRAMQAGIEGRFPWWLRRAGVHVT